MKKVKSKVTAKKAVTNSLIEEKQTEKKVDRNVKSVFESASKILGSSVTLLGVQSKNAKLEGISFGVPSINYIATGNPFIGLPYGRIMEAFSEPSNGKTTLFLNAVAQEQAKNKVCSFVDMEHAIDPNYAKKLGVDIVNLIFSQPDTGEEALEVVRELSKQGSNLIILDSIAQLVPKSMSEAKFEKQSMGLQARMLSDAFKVLTPVMSKNRTALLCVNQVKFKIGVVFGDPISTPGGQALKFASTIRMQLRLSKSEKNAVKGAKNVGELLSTKETQRLGSIANVKTVKNKIAPPFQDCEIPFMYGLGYDIAYDYFSLGVHLGYCKLTKTGFDVPKHGIVKNSEVYEYLDLILRSYKNQFGLLCDEKTILRGQVK
jgi:recombination protein RecA